MPQFDRITIEEYQRKVATTGTRGVLLAPYVEAINNLQEGEAVRLRASTGETSRQVRRRLNDASKALSKPLEIKTIGNEVYFRQAEQRPKRRGRRTRAQIEADQAAAKK